MGGGLLQLITKNIQNKYLTSNPEFTYFKKAYLRYTNFSFEQFKYNFEGEKNFGNNINCIIGNDGDLLSKSYLVIILNKNNSKTWGYVEKIGYAIIKEISFHISGKKIDSHNSIYLDINNQLNQKKNSTLKDYHDKLIGNISILKNPNKNHPEYTLIIPLQFWFCNYFGASIPMISLINKSVEIKLKLRNAIDCINYKSIPTDLPSIKNIYLVCNKIFINADEKRKFIENKHEYLIEQSQINNFNITKFDDLYNLKFYFPCKSLYWIINQPKYTNRNSFLIWNYDNNWNKTKDNFSKLIWLITRDGLSNDGTTITYKPSYFTLGDYPNLISNGNSILENLALKIEANLISYNSDGIANATIDNVNLLSSEITYEDMTLTIDDINKEDLTDAQINFLEIHRIYIINYFNYTNYVNNTNSPIVSSLLKLNGTDRFYTRNTSYFNQLQPFEFYKSSINEGINIYSFCLEPNISQATGACNFSRINNSTLEIKLGNDENDDNGIYFDENIKKGNLIVYATNYNILGIFKGSVGVTYS